jgi:hypothetical protein
MMTEIDSFMNLFFPPVISFFDPIVTAYLDIGRFQKSAL